VKLDPGQDLSLSNFVLVRVNSRTACNKRSLTIKMEEEEMFSSIPAAITQID
jgi:hypothetical protein